MIKIKNGLINLEFISTLKSIRFFIDMVFEVLSEALLRGFQSISKDVTLLWYSVTKVSGLDGSKEQDHK